jgi:hypothetical protein
MIIGLSFLFTSTPQKRTKQLVNESFCNRINTELLRDLCRVMLLKDINSCNKTDGFDTLCYDILSQVINLSEDVCNGVKNNYGRLMCYTNLAIKTKNPKLCMNFDDCYMQLASITSRKDLCDFFPKESTDARICLVIASKDRNYCKKIENEFERKRCLAHLPQNLEDCLILGNYDEVCLFKLSLVKKDLTICEKIERIFPKIECKLNVKNDFNMCESFDGIPRDICIIYYLRNELKV